MSTKKKQYVKEDQEVTFEPDFEVDNSQQNQNSYQEDYFSKRHSGDKEMPEKCAECCLQCLRMITNAHLWHLQTSSYAVHEALEDFYEELTNLADRLIEITIQLRGNINMETVYNMELVPYDEMSDEIEALKGVFDDMEKEIDEDSAEHIMEEIKSLIDETLYKINNLQ